MAKKGTEQAIEHDVEEILANPQITSEIEKAQETIDKIEKRNGLNVTIQTSKYIENGQQAMLHAGICPDTWKVSRVRIKTYQVTISAKNSETGKVDKRQMFAVQLECVRRFEDSLMKAVDAIAKRSHRRGYKLPKVRYRKPKSDPSTLVVGLTDHHFAKLAYNPEVRDEYDLGIARDLWTAAIRAAVDKCTGRDVASIILPVGNDMCHVDTRAMTTESGTQMDADTRYEKMSAVVEDSLMLAIEELRQTAPVEVLWVPGNHDYVTSRWLCRCAHHAFKSAKHVAVDTDDCPVKYRQFGKCLLGFAHGNAPKRGALMQQMPVEVPNEWAKSTACREWLTGHFHKDMFQERPSTDEQAGMTFRILPSLCGTDSYHYRGGWSLSRKRTQSLLYSHEYGLTSIFSESNKRLMGG